MAEHQMMNFGLEVLCIMVCIILLIHQMVIKIHRDTDIWFRTALISNIGMMLGDLTDWILSGAQWDGARTLFFIGITMYYACSGTLLFSFFAYIYYYWEKRVALSVNWVRAGKLMMAVQIISAAVSPFTGLIFWITEDNIYRRGSFFMLSQMTAGITYAMALCIYVLAWKKMKTKEKVCFFIYLVTPFSAELIQILNYGLVLLNMSVTLSFLLVNLFINSELDEQLRVLEETRERERLEALEREKRSQEKLIDEVITALSNAVEAKDRYTNGHSRRVAFYAAEIVRRMGWSQEEQQKVYYAGLLHDVGKIRVQDSLINKTARLTPEEYEEIRLHAQSGYHILKEISSISDFAIGARWHHERYDGTGYPTGLSGKNIPVIARVISVADAYDAMTSNRSYRPVMTQAEVRKEIEDGMGLQFDPEMAKIMLQMIDEDINYTLRQPVSTVERVILFIGNDPEEFTLVESSVPFYASYRLAGAVSAEEGIEILGKEAVDMIVLDAGADVEEGFRALSMIRSVAAYMPVIFVAENKNIQVIRRAESMRISDYLTKPLEGSVLQESIENVLLHYRIPS